MGNAIFLGIETKIIDANNADALDTLSEMAMARSKTWAILDKTRPNAWWDYMIDSNVFGEWKENFKLSQPTPTFSFGGILFLVVEATNSLLTISSWMFPELSSCANG